MTSQFAQMWPLVASPGFLPMALNTSTGSEVMQRIAAPMVGGMITAPLLSMIVIPAAYLLIRQRRLARGAAGRAP